MALSEYMNFKVNTINKDCLTLLFIFFIYDRSRFYIKKLEINLKTKILSFIDCLKNYTCKLKIHNSKQPNKQNNRHFIQIVSQAPSWPGKLREDWVQKKIQSIPGVIASNPFKGRLNSKWIYEVYVFLPKYQPKITKISALLSL